MKKILLLLLIPLTVFAGEYRVVVSSRIKALPFHVLKTSKAWTTNTVYAQGSYVKNLGEYFMAISQGTSQVNGLGPRGYVVTNDTGLAWYHIDASPRNGWMVQNISGGPLTIGFDAYVTNSAGIVKNSGQDHLDTTGGWQGEVYLISTGCTATVIEW